MCWRISGKNTGNRQASESDMYKLHIFFYGERTLLGTNQDSIFENYLQNVQDSAFFIIT